MPLTEEQFSSLLSRLTAAATDSDRIGDMDTHQFDRYAAALHAHQAALKRNLYVDSFRNGGDAEKFEYVFGAQSMQFVADLLPHIHETMLAHYGRFDELSLVDVGAGSCMGTNLLAALHSDHVVYSKLKIDAVDYIDLRQRWVKALYPKVHHQVADLFDLPSRNWDLVLCSHVVEHVENPRPFIEKLMDICKGFAFIYTPFEERDLIPHHLSTITRDTYSGIERCRLEVIKSMGWRGDMPGEYCLLAIIDCR